MGHRSGWKGCKAGQSMLASVVECQGKCSHTMPDPVNPWTSVPLTWYGTGAVIGTGAVFGGVEEAGWVSAILASPGIA